MPVPTSTRYDQIASPPSMVTTPSRSSYLRNPSSTSYYSPTVTGNGQQKLNLVTRIAIEGKAKKGHDGASIRMFLKICVPLDLVTPGSTVPLFSEENVKIHSSQVHPLDNNSVPYNFSSTVSPLLNNAARALNLPSRSRDNFASAFNLVQSNGSASSNPSLKSESSENIPPIDVQYTGHIIVSGYNISYVLPKVFLMRKRDGINESDNDDDSISRTPATRRRLSIGERNQAQFMAAIDMWVPFASRPPRSPYLLSIPTPRCLQNHIKLRIFPPANTATSFASLSSIEEDNTAWDLTSDPHVTRTASSRSSRKSAYTHHFADDESSDSSIIGVSEGCEIQGTFPSAERIRVRWAKPMKKLNIPGEENGRRRVGVEEVKGEITCIVRGKGTSTSNPEIEGVLMDIEYKGQCKGVWFPGVATLLGLDVGLEAKGSDICWPAGYATQWDISGAAGYTGFDNGSAIEPLGLGSRTSSLDSNLPVVHVSSNTKQDSDLRANSTSSTSSLLRAPLPAQNVAEYSFEGSNGTTPSSSGTLPSVSSLPTSSTPMLPPALQIRPPGSPVTLHLNMNDLQPSVKNVFAFSIAGTILVTARTNLSRINGLNSSNSSNNDKRNDPEPIVLPRFTVLAADTETTIIAVRNQVDSALVEVFNPTGDIHNDPQARKTVLQKGGFTRCGEDGGRIALKFLDAFNMTTNGHARPTTRPRTPSNGMVNRMSSISAGPPRTGIPTRNKRDGPAVIPSVKVTVTALAPDADMFPTGYAVRVSLQTPTLTDSDWLEFGMAYGSKDTPSFASAKAKPHRRVHIICATLDGVPVKSEITKASKIDVGGLGKGAPFEELAATEWVCWGKVYSCSAPGSTMVIDYLVKEDSPKSTKGKNKQTSPIEMNVLLPTFFVSVARLEVEIDVMPSLEISSLRSNFDYHHAYPAGNRLLRYSLEEFSQSQLILTIQRTSPNFFISTTVMKRCLIFSWVFFVIALYSIYHSLSNPSQDHRITDIDGYANVLDSWTDLPTVTVTTTIYGKGGAHEWFGESPIVTSSTSASTSSHPHSETLTSIMTSSTTTLQDTPIETTQSATYQDTLVDEASITNSPSRSIIQEFGLMPVENLLIFNWSADHIDTIRRALDKAVGTIEIVWNICRKVYHYPLDPP